MQISSKRRITHKRRKVTGTEKIRNIKDLEKAIKAVLSADICLELVNLAYSEDNYFEDDVFVDAETFWDVHENDDIKEMTLKFFNGEDLDSKGPANPNREYFRFDGYDNVESTDNPEDIYLDELDVEIIDYVLEHLEGVEYPEKIQKLIDNYFENVEE